MNCDVVVEGLLTPKQLHKGFSNLILIVSEGPNFLGMTDDSTDKKKVRF